MGINCINVIIILIIDPEWECAVGFLKEQSLWLIMAEPRTSSPSVSFYNLHTGYLGIPHRQQAMSTSIMITQSGPLLRMIIVAEFNVTESFGWPELQIIRNETGIVFTTGDIQPKPTGYLNVYEYNLSTRLPFRVKV